MSQGQTFYSANNPNNVIVGLCISKYGYQFKECESTVVVYTQLRFFGVEAVLGDLN